MFFRNLDIHKLAMIVMKGTKKLEDKGVTALSLSWGPLRLPRGHRGSSQKTLLETDTLALRGV